MACWILLISTRDVLATNKLPFLHDDDGPSTWSLSPLETTREHCEGTRRPHTDTFGSLYGPRFLWPSEEGGVALQSALVAVFWSARKNETPIQSRRDIVHPGETIVLRILLYVVVSSAFE